MNIIRLQPQSNTRPIGQRLRKRVLNVCTFWRNFSHYLKRGHRWRQAWAMAGDTLP
ncbi:MAG: hypothetical protein WC825_02305 [Gallionellaceae bacterium]|jgi:hypothetical protein